MKLTVLGGFEHRTVRLKRRSDNRWINAGHHPNVWLHPFRLGASGCGSRCRRKIGYNWTWIWALVCSWTGMESKFRGWMESLYIPVENATVYRSFSTVVNLNYTLRATQNDANSFPVGCLKVHTPWWTATSVSNVWVIFMVELVGTVWYILKG